MSILAKKMARHLSFDECSMVGGAVGGPKPPTYIVYVTAAGTADERLDVLPDPEIDT